MAKIAIYVIVGLVVVAALTHPAGTATAMTGVTTLVTEQSKILSGQNNGGGQSGRVSGFGNYYSF